MSLRILSLAFVASILASAPALAQDDEVIPYPDDPQETDVPRRRLPPRSDPTRTRSEETEIERKDRELSLSQLDDPTAGFGFEAVGGVMMIESSRGALVEPRLAFGARVVWEFGRLFFDEILRDGLFADLAWTYSGLSDGTTAVRGDSNFHYLTVAPAFGFPVMGKDFLVYGQVGGGVVMQFSTLNFEGRQSGVTAFKPAIQYGVGFRGRPLISVDGLTRVAFRIELTRFRRHYMDDTYLGASIGAAF